MVVHKFHCEISAIHLCGKDAHTYELFFFAQDILNVLTTIEQNPK